MKLTIGSRRLFAKKSESYAPKARVVRVARRPKLRPRRPNVKKARPLLTRQRRPKVKRKASKNGTGEQ